MCGIAGLVNSRITDSHDLVSTVSAMASAIDYRGPDDQGNWTDARYGVGLAHQRLAIIGLTNHGHQPMLSASRRFVMVFNGEIYNYKELKVELSTMGHQFHGHSDSEVLLACVEKLGLVLCEFIPASQHL